MSASEGAASPSILGRLQECLDKLISMQPQVINRIGFNQPADFSEVLEILAALTTEQAQLRQETEQHLTRANEEISRRQRAEQYAVRCEYKELALRRQLEAAEARADRAEVEIERLKELTR